MMMMMMMMMLVWALMSWPVVIIMVMGMVAIEIDKSLYSGFGRNSLIIIIS